MLQSQARLEAISDGIFAIAATLIVVSLDVPESFADLRASLIDLPSFGISFAALVFLWWTHYNFFRRTEAIDYQIIIYNFGFLFVMLCYIFPLKFLANLIFRRASVASVAEIGELFALYSGGFALIFLFVVLLYRRAARLEAHQRAYLRYKSIHYLIYVGVGIGSVLLALLGVGVRYGVPGFLYWFLGPLCYLHGRLYGVAQPG